MGALDGNNSLKWFLRNEHHMDTPTFTSDYFISHQYVDQFKDEVKRKVQKPHKVQVHIMTFKGSQLKIPQASTEVEGDPTDGHPEQTVCTDRWHATMADTLKGLLMRQAFLYQYVTMELSGL